MAQVIAVPYVNLYTAVVTQRYFAFILNPADFTLSLNSSVDGSGATWSWKSLGSPASGLLSTASATAYFSGKLAADGSAINYFNVFVIAKDGNLWLISSTDDGATWGSWKDQGAPAGGIAGGPDVVSRQSVHGGFEIDVYCQVISFDGHLHVNYSQNAGGSWNWADRGKPASASLLPGRTGSIPYFDGSRQSLYAFAVGSDNHLYANSGDLTTWGWQDLGQPSASVSVPSVAPETVTFLYDVSKKTSPEAIYVFVLGSDNHLYACYSLGGGAGWTWEARGTPASPIQTFFTNALLVSNESAAAIFTENVFVFAVGDDGNLYADFTADASRGSTAIWGWQNLGAPPEASLVLTNGAAASSEVEPSLSDVQMFAFASDTSTDVHSLRWDGTKWTWYDQLGP